MAVLDPISHTESRNAVESILRQVPGFRGYLEREFRRDSDQLARMWIADQLQKCKTALDRWQRGQLDAGNLAVMPLCERLRSRLDLFQSRVRGAMRGYSGFFDLVRVDEQLLDRVYQLDMSLLDDVAALRRVAEEIGQHGGTPEEALASLQQKLDALSDEFDRRSELLEGLN